MFLFKQSQITNTMALAASLMESCLYGIYATIFAPAAYLIWSHRCNGRFNIRSRMLGVAFVILFALSTIHLVLSLVMLFNNIVNIGDLGANYQITSDSNVPIYIALTSVWVAMVIVSDAIVIWRCWVLWNKKAWILIFFGLLETAFLACSTYTGVIFAHVNTMSSMYIGKMMTWYTAINILSLVINFALSGLICFKLYMAGRRIERMTGHMYIPHYYTIALTYIESGSIYPTLMIVSLGLYLSGTSYGWIIFIIAPQILAMVPTVMFLIVLLKKQPFFEAQQSHTISSRSWTHEETIFRPHTSHPSSSNGTMGMEVHVCREEFKLADLTSPAGVHVVDMS